MKRTKPPTVTGTTYTGKYKINCPQNIPKDKLENWFANIGFPFGGRVPYPPDDCPAPRFHYNEARVKWTDTQFCLRKCSPNYCNAYKRYRKFIYRNLRKE